MSNAVNAADLAISIADTGGSVGTISRASGELETPAGEVVTVYGAPQTVMVKIDNVPTSIQDRIGERFNPRYKLLKIASLAGDLTLVSSGDLVVVLGRRFKIESSELEYLAQGWGKYLAIERD